MQSPQRIHLNRPTSRLHRTDPQVLSMRKRLDNMSDAEFRRLNAELRTHAKTGDEGELLISVLQQGAASHAPVACTEAA